MKMIEDKPVQHFINTRHNLAEFEANYLAGYNRPDGGFFDTLVSLGNVLDKYQRVIVVLAPQKLSNLKVEIAKGFHNYCLQFKKEFSIIENAAEEIPSLLSLYFAPEEVDVARLIKIAKVLNYKPGQELGLISLHDTPIKRLLGITVISADREDAVISDLAHEQQGRKNKMHIKRRSSV